MRIWKAVFSILTILFGAIGLMKWLPFDLSLPVMFFFMGLTMLANADESVRAAFSIMPRSVSTTSFPRIGSNCTYS